MKKKTKNESKKLKNNNEQCWTMKKWRNLAPDAKSLTISMILIRNVSVSKRKSTTRFAGHVFSEEKSRFANPNHACLVILAPDLYRSSFRLQRNASKSMFVEDFIWVFSRGAACRRWALESSKRRCIVPGPTWSGRVWIADCRYRSRSCGRRGVIGRCYWCTSLVPNTDLLRYIDFLSSLVSGCSGSLYAIRFGVDLSPWFFFFSASSFQTEHNSDFRAAPTPLT